MDTILIIEDEQVLAEVLSQKLRALGYGIEIVRDGAAGFEAMRRSKPDLVILDIFLPTMNGIEILEKKRSDHEIASIPVIVLSNSLQPIEGKALESFGAYKFLVKADLTPEDVVTQVQKALAIDREKKDAGGTDLYSLQGKKVLVVEDDEFLGSILTRRLEDAGATVTHATNGEEAMGIIKTLTPDVALLDILLPGLSGFDVLEHIRTDERIKDMPVIVVSNFNQDADKDRAFKLGATYLVKAMVNPDEILSEIGKVLRG